MEHVLNFNTVRDILCQTEPLFKKATVNVEVVPFYSPAYDITYGNQQFDDEYIETYARFIKTHKIKGVFEAFGGAGIESNILAKHTAVKNCNFYVADIVDRKQKAVKVRNTNNAVTYIKYNCIKDDGVLLPVDFAFVGGLNVSLCEVHSIKALENHFRTMNKLLKIGGFYAPSFFDSPFLSEHKISIDVEVENAVLVDGPYKGLQRLWGLVECKNAYTQEHTYYSIVMLYERKTGKIEKVFKVLPYVARSWPIPVIKELLERNGFRFYEYLTSPNNALKNTITRGNMVFIKVSDV